jgi:hypothetical protein
MGADLIDELSDPEKECWSSPGLEIALISEPG